MSKNESKMSLQILLKKRFNFFQTLTSFSKQQYLAFKTQSLIWVKLQNPTSKYKYGWSQLNRTFSMVKLQSLKLQNNKFIFDTKLKIYFEYKIRDILNSSFIFIKLSCVIFELSNFVTTNSVITITAITNKISRIFWSQTVSSLHKA